MAINIGSGINVLARIPNIDVKYGPYPSREAAFEALGPSGYDCLCIGLTVAIQPEANGPVDEYWFKSGCSSEDDLVKKVEAISIEFVEE